MNLDETTLLEIEDYINKLDELFGLTPETLTDIEYAIRKQHKANSLKTSNESEEVCKFCGAKNTIITDRLHKRCANCHKGW